MVGWVDIKSATPATYQALGYKCGLEVHQQLKTEKKLFCRCPAGIYHDFDNFDAEIVRHMRPNMSELGEYDGTALMEFKTRKTIVYRIKNDSACTYEVDDTPPFRLNPEALDIAMQIALLLKMNIVGELHITRKQYLDGSIPTGFQRTTILGIEGSISLSNKTVRVIQFSVEEDSCREVSDIRHRRTYYADRLGMPLIETVTYPDMATPQEAAEAGQFIRFLARSSGLVRTGIGAARQDVNVSVTGGTRVEIKGVAHINWIPKLTHNEAFRQKALLVIQEALLEAVPDWKEWSGRWRTLNPEDWKHVHLLRQVHQDGWQLVAVNLPGFAGFLSHFTQPGHTFGDELSDRLKVIACLEKPNMFHSEELQPVLTETEWLKIASLLQVADEDAQILLWTPEEDLKTAVETIFERCQLAFKGVPNETRKSLPNGITVFERVLPGPDRMYPDTDSAPISVRDEMIETARQKQPVHLSERLNQLAEWKVPLDAYHFLLRHNLMPAIESLAARHNVSPRYLALLYAHHLKHLQGNRRKPFDPNKLSDLIKFMHNRQLTHDILLPMLKVIWQHPKMEFASVLNVIGYKKTAPETVLAEIPVLHEMFATFKKKHKTSEDAYVNWCMGKLRNTALGNVPLSALRTEITAHTTGEVSHA